MSAGAGGWRVDFMDRRHVWRYSTLSIVAVAVVLVGIVLSAPAAGAATLKQDYLYVAGYGNVTVISASDDSIKATIGGVSVFGSIAASPDGKKVYVCGQDGVYVINTSTNTAVRKASGYGSYFDIAVNPVLNEYYVGVHATKADNYRPYILVLNANTDAEVMRFNTSGDGTAMDMAVSPDGDKLYVCFQSSLWANFTVYDLSSRAYLSTKSILLPDDMAVSPDGKEVYVACADSEHFFNRVYVINASSYAVKHQIDSIDGPRGVAFSPDGTKAFITNYYSDKVSVVDTASRAVVRTVSLGKANPNKVAVTPDGKKVYVSHYMDVNGISVINTSDYSVAFIGNAGNRLQELTISQVPQSFIIRLPVVTLVPHVTSPLPTPDVSLAPTPGSAPTSVPIPSSVPAPTEVPVPGPSVNPETNVTQNPSPTASQFRRASSPGRGRFSRDSPAHFHCSRSAR
jgi:YVTN family beta-propeller protein